MEYNVKPSNLFHELIYIQEFLKIGMITCKCYMREGYKTIVILKPKSATGIRNRYGRYAKPEFDVGPLIHYTTQLFS